MIELKFTAENAVELAKDVTNVAELLAGTKAPAAEAPVAEAPAAEAPAAEAPAAEAPAPEQKRRRRRTKAEIEADNAEAQAAEEPEEPEAQAAEASAPEAPAPEAPATDLNYEVHIRPVLAELVNQPDGGREAAVAILRSFGVANGKDLKPEQLADVLKAAKDKIEELKKEDFI